MIVNVGVPDTGLLIISISVDAHDEQGENIPCVEGTGGVSVCNDDAIGCDGQGVCLMSSSPSEKKATAGEEAETATSY